MNARLTGRNASERRSLARRRLKKRPRLLARRARTTSSSTAKDGTSSVKSTRSPEEVRLPVPPLVFPARKNRASDFWPRPQRGSTAACTACLTASARTRSIRTLTSSGGRGRSSPVGTLRAPSRRLRRSNSDPRTSRVRAPPPSSLRLGYFEPSLTRRLTHVWV